MYSVLVKIVPCTLLTFLSLGLIKVLREADKSRKKLTQNFYELPSLGHEVVPEDQLLQSKDSRKLKPTESINNAKISSDRTSRMLLGVLTLFLVSEFPLGLLALLSGILSNGFYENVNLPLGNLFDMIALTNSALNFIIYCTMSKKFRETFFNIIFPNCSFN